MSRLSQVQTISFQGLEAIKVDLEVDITPSEEFSLTLVGLPSTAVKESKDRVMAAIRHLQHSLKGMHCTINLAPADLKKEGSIYDLPIAIGLLGSMGKIAAIDEISNYLIAGELGLGGELRPVKGALAIAMLARDLGLKGVMIPEVNAQEASAVPGIIVVPVRHLKEAVAFFQHPAGKELQNTRQDPALFLSQKPAIDFSDIRGQAHVKRAMEIAAAGGHNIVLYGPPGTGKTMLAKALIGIMPELTFEEAMETTRIHSIAGLLPLGQSLVTQRPFRSPHHTVSYAGLIGGGSTPRPGEVTLAHNGILFLDELPEFSRSVLEVLRQPLEDRVVTISRSKGHFTYPSNFICIAAMNPCPCGYLGHPDKPCKDTPLQVERYRGKVSGPLWDRMDMHVEVPSLRYGDILEGAPGETSKNIKERVAGARKKQSERYGKVKSNALMTKADLKEHAILNPGCREVLRKAVDVMGISARACDRLIRISRTIADLADVPTIAEEHLMEALNYRKLDF